MSVGLRHRHTALLGAQQPSLFHSANRKTIFSLSSRLKLILLALMPVAFCAACGSNAPAISFKPNFIPIEFTFTPSGISVEGQVSIATLIGTFTIGGIKQLNPPDSGSIYVVIRDQDAGFDHIYEVHAGTDNLTAVINGTTRISVTNSEVIIDVTNGNVQSIEFEKTAGLIPIANATPAWEGKLKTTFWWLFAIGVIYLLFWLAIKDE